MSYAPNPGSMADKLIKAIRATARAMRTDELARHTGCKRDAVPALLESAVSAGLVTVCKVKVPGQRANNEYRSGPGVPPITEAKTLKPLRPTIIPVRSIWDGGVPPHPATTETAQPEVAHSNTGSDPQMTTSSPAAVAVAAEAETTATPEPEAKLRELGPASPKAPAGNVDLGFSIDDGGSLTLYLNDGMSDPLVLDPVETLALGDFLHLTEGIWRP